MSPSVNFDQGCLRPTDLTDHDPVGALSKGLPHQVAERDLSAAVETGLSCLHLRHVRQVRIDLEYLFAGDNSPIGRDFAKETIHKCCLPGSRSAGDENREVLAHCLAEQLRGCRSQRLPLDQLVESRCSHDELSDLDVEAIWVCHRWSGDMHPRTVRELGGDDGR